MPDLLEMQGECNYHLVRVNASCGFVWVDFRACGDPNFSDDPDLFLDLSIEDAETLRSSLSLHIQIAKAQRLDIQSSMDKEQSNG